MYYLCATLQMLETAPSGVISNRAFCDTIMDMTALTVSAANAVACFVCSSYYSSSSVRKRPIYVAFVFISTARDGAATRLVDEHNTATGGLNSPDTISIIFQTAQSHRQP